MRITLVALAFIYTLCGHLPAAEKRFELFDVNKNGVLSREEFIEQGRKPNQ